MAATHPEIVDLHRKLFPNTCYGLGDWRRYLAGVWEAIPELTIRLELQQIARRSDVPVTAGLIASTTELLRPFVFVRDEIFDRDINILTFADCTLDLTTREARPHSSDDYVTTKLPYPYNPEATAQGYDKFLTDTLSESVKEFFLEYAGYAMTASTKHETALWLWGPPGGGKSTCIEGLRAMLGPRSCILGLSEIDRSAFALSQLPGKTLAISTEQPSTPGHYVKHPNIINAIISGEPVTVDRKFRDQITITPRAKLVWGMNELPRVDTAGVGLFRRVVPVYFPSIPIEKRNPMLKEFIASEGAGIANMALEGLTRLERRGKFAIPSELILERESYRVQNDIPQLFADECLLRTEGKEIKSASLYQVYTGWCQHNGHGVQSSTAFAAEMKRLGFAKVPRRDAAYWQGLEVKAGEPINIDDYADTGL